MPVPPTDEEMMAKDKANSKDETPTSRRKFLRKLWLGLGILASVETVGMIGAYFRPGSLRADVKHSDRVMTAGMVDDFKKGTVTAFRRGRFYLVRLEDGRFLALSSKCTHLGCTVPWVSSKKQFICPCHSSVFDVRGDVVKSPAPRPLDRYAVIIENKAVKVDISKTIQGV